MTGIGSTTVGEDTSGSCLCGKVRFTARLPSRWVAHCHCTICQRAHGAAFVTWVSLDAGGVQILDDERLLHWYESSPGAQRGFCRGCGSTLFFRSARWPGELHVARANFTGPVDRAPQAHGFWDSHVEWLDVRDDLPRKS